MRREMKFVRDCYRSSDFKIPILSHDVVILCDGMWPYDARGNLVVKIKLIGLWPNKIRCWRGLVKDDEGTSPFGASVSPQPD